MAISMLVTQADGGDILASDWNAEFLNIINNALSLISPLTGDLAAGGNRITGLSLGSAANPSLQFTGDTNTGFFSSGADTLDFATGGANCWRMTSTGKLLAVTDNTYDIGASGATRPKDLYLGGNIVLGGSLALATTARITGANRFRMLQTTVRATLSTPLALTQNVDVAIVFDGTDTFDTDTLHDPAGSNTRLTAAITGKYLVTAYAEIGSVSGGFFDLSLKVNNTTKFNQSRMLVGSGAGSIRLNVVDILSLTAADYVEAIAFTSITGQSVAAASLAMCYIGE
jgi:hypothetical protein